MKNKFLCLSLLFIFCVFGTPGFAAPDTEKPAAENTSEPQEAPSAFQPKKRVKDYSPYPQPDSGYVTDVAKLLNREQEETIEQILWKVEEKSNCEIVVVIVNSIKDYKGTANGSIETFATGLFDKYGIGNLPRNDGILLFVAYKDRKVKIELGKFYGHDFDYKAMKIVQETIIPKFKQSKFADGIYDGTIAIVETFTPLQVSPLWQRYLPVILVSIGIIVLCFIAFSLFKSGKKGWGWVCVGVIFILLLVLMRLIVAILSSANDVTGSSGHSSSWSSGGFGGGFGGGSSGGGGATGSW